MSSSHGEEAAPCGGGAPSAPPAGCAPPVPAARVFEEAGIDVVLVGDSAANVVYGYPTSLPVTVEELIKHTF